MVYFFLIALAAFTWFALRDLKQVVAANRASSERRLDRLELEAMALRRRLEEVAGPAPDAESEVPGEPEEVAAGADEPVERVPGEPDGGEVPGEPGAAPTPGPPRPPGPPPLPTGVASGTGLEEEAGRPLVPPPESSEPPVSPPPGPPTRRGTDWEQWIGVRGAALLGGIVLAVAGFFFLRYSIEAGWIKPPVRVALGLLSGTGAIVGGELLRRRRFEATANGLAGAGIVLLYASTWAARALYELIGFGAAFVVMTLITVAGGVLSWRYRSLVVALLGLLGGFATPLLLSSGRDNPFGLFAYVLLLNVGLAILARRRNWPLLGYLSLGGTLFYQALWILFRMDSDERLLGLGVLTLFAIFFVVTGVKRRSPGEVAAGTAGAGAAASPPWLQLAGLLTPVLFVLYFAASARLAEPFYPLAALLVLLGAGAAWLSRVHRLPVLEEGMATATLAVVAVWWMQIEMTGALSWEGALSVIALALPSHLALELDRRRRSGAEATASGRGALIASFGLLAWLVVAGLVGRGEAFSAMMVGWLALTGLLLRQAAVVDGRGRRQLLAAVALGIGFCGLFVADGFGAPQLSGEPTTLGLLALAVLVAIGFQLHAVALSRQPRTAEAAALLIALIPLVGMLAYADLEPLPFHAASLALGLLAALAATRRPAPVGYGVLVGLLALVHLAWSVSIPDAEMALYGLLLQAVAVALLSFWPFLAGSRLHRRPALYAAAAAAPAWFFSLRLLYEKAFGDGTTGLLAVLLGGLSLAAALRSRQLAAPAARVGTLVWFAAAALGFLSLAIPLQLDREWITVGWALEGLAVTALWKRIDHPGLKYLGLGLLAAVGVRLLANPALLGYHPKAAWPIVNWLMYTYLVPAAALLGTASLLRPLEVKRGRPWEESLYVRRVPVGAYACALAAIAVVFAWLNLAIVDLFSPGPQLALGWERLPARDLTLSLAWGLYALVLLAIGVARGSGALRWISLGVLMITIGKVFLYDLGELQDLYRVASLVGLAACLILVSLLYQRFVFSRPAPERS